MKIKSFLLILAVSFVLLAACNYPVASNALPPETVFEVTATLEIIPTQIPPTDTPISAPTDTLPPTATETETALPPTDTPVPTETALPPTDTPAPTLTLTPTEPPVASPPPAVQTTILRVDVSKLSNSSFRVPAYTDLTLLDTGNDGKANSCKITKTEFSQSITIPVSMASAKFQLPPGEYRLSCEVPNKTAKIVSN